MKTMNEFIAVLKKIKTLPFAILTGAVCLSSILIFRWLTVPIIGISHGEIITLLIVSTIIGFLRPDKFWLWGISTALFFPALMIYGLIVKHNIPVLSMDFIMYLIEMCMVLPITILPGLMGSAIGAGLNNLIIKKK